MMHTVLYAYSLGYSKLHENRKREWMHSMRRVRRAGHLRIDVFLTLFLCSLVSLHKSVHVYRTVWHGVRGTRAPHAARAQCARAAFCKVTFRKAADARRSSYWTDVQRKALDEEQEAWNDSSTKNSPCLRRKDFGITHL